MTTTDPSLLEEEFSITKGTAQRNGLLQAVSFRLGDQAGWPPVRDGVRLEVIEGSSSEI